MRQAARTLAALVVIFVVLGGPQDTYGWNVILAGSLYCLARMTLPWVRSRPAPCISTLEGSHQWGPWSQPYQVTGRWEWWQERRCQCGNRDFRVASRLARR